MSIQEHHAAIKHALDEFEATIRSAEADGFNIRLMLKAAGYDHEIPLPMPDAKIVLEYSP